MMEESVFMRHWVSDSGLLLVVYALDKPIKEFTKDVE